MEVVPDTVTEDGIKTGKIGIGPQVDHDELRKTAYRGQSIPQPQQ